MGKVILIMDDPKNCMDCPLGELSPDCEVCYGAGKDLDIMLANKKADWCPLKEVPEEIDEKPVSEYEFGSLGKGYEVGWNACLKAILNGGINKDEPIHNRDE